MAKRTGGLVGKARERLEEVTGQTLVPVERYELLEQSLIDYRLQTRQLEDIGYSVLNYFGGKPMEMRTPARLNIVQRARIVWMNDAQAGAAVELMNDFCFGRGVPAPRCKDKLVQEKVDEAWDDPDNKAVLTTLEAQLALGTDLALQPLDPGTEIRMADGSAKRLGDIQPGEYVLTHSGEKGRVADNVDAGAQPRYELVTKEGRRVVGAGSHPFLTVERGWRRLDELESGDELVREPVCEGLVASISGDEARLLGYFVGDGSCSSGNAGFTNTDPMIVADFTAACERQGWRVTGEGYGPYTYGVSGGVRPWLRRHGVAGKTAHDKRVPDVVLRAPNWIVAEFLRGYFASDGCVSREVFMATVSRGLAEDVQHLLGRLGVRSSILWNNAPSRNARPIWTVRVRRESYAAFLGTVEPLAEKGTRLRALVASLPVRAEIALAAAGEATCQAAGCGRAVAHVGLCEKHYAHHRRWGTTATAHSESPHDRVLAVEALDEGPVRCLAVEHDDHSYMANGVVTHNSNLFLLMFDDKPGPPKLSILEHDSVDQIVDDQEMRHRALWYVTRTKQAQEYDFKTGQWKVEALKTTIRPTYYEHWRNVALLKEEGREGEGAAPDPEDVGAGKVYHARINRSSEQKFGIPRFQRTLRWYSAYNQAVKDRLDIVSAAAQLIMKRKIKGTPEQLVRDAAKALSRRSPLASSYGDNVTPAERGVRPASIIEENESVEHQAFNLDTKATNAQADMNMIRAPIAAAERFTQAYFGDASNSSLATATSLELPILKAVESRQETFEGIFRWFLDRVIEKAVDDGEIPRERGPDEMEDVASRTVAPDTWDPDARDSVAAALREAFAADMALGREIVEVGKVEGLSEIVYLVVSRSEDGYHYRLAEAHEDKPTDEESTERDLGYEFSMPSPLRRMMADLIGAITQIAQTFDPNNTNTELSRALLTIALGEGLEVQDAADLVDSVLPKGYLDPLLQAQMAAATQPPGGPAPSDGSDQIPGGYDGNFYSAPMNPTRPENMPRSGPYATVQAHIDESGEYVGMTTRSRNGTAVFWPARRRHQLEEAIDNLPEHRARHVRGKIDDVGELFRGDVIDVALAGLDDEVLSTPARNGDG